MNVFKELEALVKDREDSEIINVPVSEVKRMIGSANAMNEKAEIIRDFYQRKWEGKV
jgi:hypothetical protein